MAAYRRGWMTYAVTVTCGLTACTPGSAPGPTLGIEYGKAFAFKVGVAKAYNNVGIYCHYDAC